MLEQVARKISLFYRDRSLQYLPAIVAAVAMTVIAIIADWQMRRINEDGIRASVADQAGRIRTRLEASINGNVQLVSGLVAALEIEPDMGPERFAKLSKHILRHSQQIRNVVAAPDFVVTMVYPLKGNERVLGLDYRKNAAQRAAAMHVRAIGLIARFPVNCSGAACPEPFWGLVSAVLDLDKLYTDSGLMAAGLPIEVAIASRSPGKAMQPPFFGSSRVFANNPVQMVVKLGHDDWMIAAVPKGGWRLPAADVWQFRAALLLCGLLIIAPMFWAGRLMAERQRNIQILQQHEDDMKALSHRLQIALETSKIGVWEFDISTDGLIWDARMKDLYGVDPDRAVATYQDWESALHPDDLAAAQAEFAEAIAKEHQYQSEFRVVTHTGSVRHIRAIGTTYHDSRGNKKIVGVNWDVTEDISLQEDLRAAKHQSDIQNSLLEQARVRMESAALHDALTGLPNRRYLDQIMAEREGATGRFAEMTILHIDLDRFKDINDTLGHAAGDVILKHAARMLSDNIHEGDFIARIGGDEFVVVSGKGNGDADYPALAARLVDALSRPVDFEGHECRVGASIGIAERSTMGERVDQLLVNADIALYEAKRRGRNRVEMFTNTLRQVAINTKKTADDILRGLEQNEFIAWFQPQFDARTHEIVGMEALARWNHPTKGILAPDTFLKIAESLKVVAAIDKVILDQALFQQARLAANGIDIPKVSVNISAQRLVDETLISNLEGLVFRPGSLSFELLESISFDGDDDALVPQIDRIKKLGIDIEIDDFGTGYASIVTLLKLNPRRLKIDRQLIIPLLETSSQQQLVNSIIDIGKSRNIEIVAEGVETMAHAEILADLGCDTLQGYAFARPMSPADLLVFARERRWLKDRPKRRKA